MSRILIVEDEPKIARFLELELTHEGYEVEKAADGRAGVDAALADDFDLILLDVMLPQLNGLEVLRRVRREKSTPVIMLTARDAVMDKVAGLDAGADDYITKPFAIEELLARVRVALKHAPAPGVEGTPGAGGMPGTGWTAGGSTGTPGAGGTEGAAGSRGAGTASAASRQVGAPIAQPGHVLVAGEVVLDIDRHTVTARGQRVELTNREFEVLRCLMENRDIVLSRDKLVQMACGYDYVGETNIIDVYVRHIRAKIDDPFGIKLITTVRGVGYVVRAA